MASKNTLNVYWGPLLVGSLKKSTGQDMIFQYAEEYLASPEAQAISLSLPLQVPAFEGSLSRSWFANLLPEGEIRGHIARKLGVSERNPYAILQGIGGECAGALRLLPESVPHTTEGKLHPLPWDELEAKIAATPRPSLLALVLQDGELRLSLAGAQDKLPVHLSHGQLSLPGGNAASTHLLKTSSGAFPDLVQNELFCLTLARAVGLNIPPAEMAATKTPILLVERYDRLTNPDGSIHRLHQEDFNQALGLPPESKYENEGGPSLVKLFDVLSHGSELPLADKRDLLTWVLFNFLIGNADAHAKNVSLLYGPTEDKVRRRLAPFYDLVCTAVYDQISTKQAQKIGGEYRPRYIARRHWERLADSINVNPRYLCSLGLALCDKVEENAPQLSAQFGQAHGGASTLAKVNQVIETRMSRLRIALS